VEFGLDWGGRFSVIFLLVMLPVSFVTAYLSYRRMFLQAKLLFSLRALALLLLGLAVADPILYYGLRTTEKPKLALLLDNSASMGIKEEMGKRNEILENIIWRKDGLLKNLKKRGVSPLLFKFSEELVPLSSSEDSLSLEGKRTNIGEALNKVIGRLGIDSLQGMILLSDGINNFGPDPIRLAQSLGLPIYTVGIGSREKKKDVALNRIFTNEIVYPGDRIPVEVTLKSQGFKGEKTILSLKEGNLLLDSKEVSLSGEGEGESVILHFIPRTPGVHQYTVSIPSQAGEDFYENNQKSFAIRVLKNKMKIAILACPGFEFKFLRSYLKGDKDIDPTYFIFRGDGSFSIHTSEGEREGHLPSDTKIISLFDLVILLDFPARELKRMDKLLSEYVENKGGALLICGGENLGDYKGSSLEKLLPLLLGNGIEESPYQLVISPEGETHPIMNLLPDLEERKDPFSDLPPLLGFGRILGRKSGTTVLAVHPKFSTPQGKMPLVAVGRFGLGKVMLVAGFPLWRWDFLLWGVGKTNELYQKFWGNCIRGLVMREELGRLKITTDKPSYLENEELFFQGQVYDENYRPLEEVELRVRIWEKEGKGEGRELILESREGGWYWGKLRGLSPGNYSFQGEAINREKNLGKCQGEFSVSESNLEFEKTEMDEGLLRKISEVSGGKYYSAIDVSSLPQDLQLKFRKIFRRHEVKLRYHPLLFCLLLLLVGGEWSLRRRRGLA